MLNGELPLITRVTGINRVAAYEVKPAFFGHVSVTRVK